MKIRSLRVRERRAGDSLCVSQQFLFELVGTHWVIQRNEIRDLGEVPLRPA
jgi:hypothetical protein